MKKINNEHRLLLKVMKNFEGMHKIEVFDTLQKIETILFYTSSPITNYSIQKIVEIDPCQKRNIDPFYFTILPNGNFCECVGSNNWLHIYKEQKRGLMRLSPFDTYYFKTKYAPLELLKLTRKNLLENLENTWEETPVKAFLKQYQPGAKDPVTDSFLILAVK